MFIFEVYAGDQPITYLLTLLLLNAVKYCSANIAPNKPYIFPNKEARSLVTMTTAIIKVCKFVSAKQYNIFHKYKKRKTTI